MKKQNFSGRNPVKSPSKNRHYVHDHYTRKAFQEGYNARSVFKLKEIDQKHKLLKPGMRVLDLGAAPGSWSRYVLQRIQASGQKAPRSWLCAVDLQELDRELQTSPHVCFLQADFTTPELRQLLLPYVRQGGLFDVVLSDMAPRTTGNRTVDTGHSEALVAEILAALPQFLKVGGSLLFKLFQGGGERHVEEELRDIFTSCQRLKPETVRSRSFEIYFLCRNYLPK
ncbi:MAG: RlmE family RNA methyltransferase [Spirochaetota bacterium]